MKKGTKTWKLWWMLIVHVLAIIGITGLYAEYIVSRPVDSTIQLLATLALMAIVAVFITNFVKILIRILKRKQLW